MKLITLAIVVYSHKSLEDSLGGRYSFSLIFLWKINNHSPKCMLSKYYLLLIRSTYLQCY